MGVLGCGLDPQLDVADASQPGVLDRGALVIDAAEFPDAGVGGQQVLVAADEGMQVDAAGFLLAFDDGHDTGLYTWELLHELGQDQEKNWARYEQRMAEIGMSRDRDVTKLAALVKNYTPPKPCG